MATTPMGPLPSHTAPSNLVTASESASVSSRVLTLFAAHEWDTAAEILQEAELDPAYSSDSAFLLVFLQGIALLNAGQLILAHNAFSRRGIPALDASEHSLSVLTSSLSQMAAAVDALLSGGSLLPSASAASPSRLSLLDANVSSVLAKLASLPSSAAADSAIGSPSERAAAAAALALAPGLARAAVVRELARGAASLPLKGVARALEWPRGEDLAAFLRSLHCEVCVSAGIVRFTSLTAAAHVASLPSSVLASTAALASHEVAEELLGAARELDGVAKESAPQ